MSAAINLADIRRRPARRTGALIAACFLACLALTVAALSMGVAGVPPLRALPAIFGAGDRFDVLVVQDLRLPRTLAAVLAGLAFGTAGALFQSTLRNNLASPDILGISGGASLGAVTAVIGAGATGATVTASALAGGLTAAVAIWALAWRGGLHGMRFVLVGVGISYVCASLLAWWLAEAEEREAGTVLLWTVGSVADVRGSRLAFMAAGIAAMLIVAALIARQQRALALGDDHARGLGVALNWARAAALLTGVALVALATAVTGPIAFVALVSPAIARRLIDDGSAAIAASAAVGATLTLAADTVGQFSLAGVSAPVGVVTGLIGAPYLLVLLARHQRHVGGSTS